MRYKRSIFSKSSPGASDLHIPVPLKLVKLQKVSAPPKRKRRRGSVDV